MTQTCERITLLRIHGTSSHVSADVFEHVFRRHIGSLFSTVSMTSREFASLTGHEPAMREALGAYDFICPDYTMMPLVPWLMQWRNQNRLSFGILFISHSPGMYGLEWYLMQKMIRPRDLIVAPSNFAGQVIRLLAPALIPHVEIIPHPLSSKNTSSNKSVRGGAIVTLSRMVEDKLIHRQIDAMAKVVHTYGYRHLTMIIGGSLTDPESGELTSYARLLYFKISRLNLEDHVFLSGEISEKEKHDFFRDAFVSVNLSKTLEEAFPKASVEALSFGLPVIATVWNGFKETVGKAGILLDVSIDSHGRADVDADELAQAIIRLYEKPVPQKSCHDQIQHYDAEHLREKYRKSLLKRISDDWHPTVEQPCGPGLLDTLSFLKIFSHDELMTYHSTWVSHYLEDLKTNQKKPVQTPDLFFRFFVAEALKDPLTRFYAYKENPDSAPDRVMIQEPDQSCRNADFHEKMRQCIALSTNDHSRRTLLTIFANRPAPDLLNEAIRHFKQTEGGIPMADYFIPYADFLENNHAAVCRFFHDHFIHQIPEQNQADRLCLWAKAALQCQDLTSATACMARWLDRFMDEPEALPVHVAYLKLLLQHPDIPEETIDTQRDIVNHLSFDRNLVQQLEILSYAR